MHMSVVLRSNISDKEQSNFYWTVLHRPAARPRTGFDALPGIDLVGNGSGRIVVEFSPDASAAQIRDALRVISGSPDVAGVHRFDCSTASPEDKQFCPAS